MCVGVPGQVIEISDAAKMLGIVNVGGIKREISLACIIDPEHSIESCVGEWVLIHVGFAMSRVDEAEAAKTLALLTELGEVQLEMDAMLTSGRK
jgi:hydrogenase expression/formation protein HypC